MDNPEKKQSEEAQEENAAQVQENGSESELPFVGSGLEGAEHEPVTQDVVEEGGAADEFGETEPPPPNENRLRRFVWRAARWILALLVIFMLGFLTAVYGLYRPALNERQVVERQLADAHEEIAVRENDIESSQGKINDLEARIEELSALETLNQELELHVTILSTRSDVVSARLALANEDPPRARAALARTDETLARLEGLLAADQIDLVTDMRDRLELVLSEIDDDTFAADSDLGVLERSLLELENDYFTQP